MLTIFFLWENELPVFHAPFLDANAAQERGMEMIWQYMIWQYKRRRHDPNSHDAVTAYHESTRRENFFEILLNQPEIGLYLPFSDWFGTKQMSVWFQINGKMVNTIWFRSNLLRFRNKLEKKYWKNWKAYWNKCKYNSNLVYLKKI